MKEKKLYIIVDSKLDIAYQAVQGGHVLAKWMQEYPEQAKEWNNGTLIYLVANLVRTRTKLHTKGVEHSQFFEPDMNNFRTAIACYCYGDYFTEYKLLGK